MVFIIVVIDVFVWLVGVTVRATQRSPVQFLAVLPSGNDLGQVVHTHASLTKQYSVVPVKVR